MGQHKTHKNRIDLTGQIFGNLKVIKHDDERIRRNRKPYWICLCNKCSKTISVRGESLKSGKTKSCGCYKPQLIPGPTNSNFRGYKEIPLTLWSQIQERARRINKPINLSIEYLWELFLKQNRKCSLSGQELYFGSHQSNGLTPKGNASLDRIDNTKGYVKGNVQWVHKDINWMKADYDQNYFIELCEGVANYKKCGIIQSCNNE